MCVSFMGCVREGLHAFNMEPHPPSSYLLTPCRVQQAGFACAHSRLRLHFVEVSQSTSVFHTVSQGTHLFQCGVAAEGFFSIGDPAALFWPLLPTSEQLHQCNSHCFARNKLASIATRLAGPCSSIRDLIVCISLPLQRHPPGGAFAAAGFAATGRCATRRCRASARPCFNVQRFDVF